MQHRFPYDEFQPVEIPDGMVDGVYELDPAIPAKSDVGLIEDALDEPIASERLEARVRPGMQVVVVVDDGSRNTRIDLMLPAVLARLASAGLSPDDITVFVALGTHRRMTDGELRRKYTAAVVDAHRIVNHDWHDRSAYVSVGQSQYGFDIRIHHAVVEADFVIGVGQTIPHLIAGFGGGCKIINPGCSDSETIGNMHWMCSRVPEGGLFAVRDNPVREVIDEVAIRAGLRFIINEVPGPAGRLAGAFAGDPIEAHRKACEAAAAACRVEIGQRTEIVLADAYPSDIDFWQAMKGFRAAYDAVKPGGTVILVSPCPEGACSQHDEVTSIGYIPTEETRRLVSRNALDLAVAGNLVLGRQMFDIAEPYLVTQGISREDTLAMHINWALSPQAAIDQAIARHGRAARINVLYKAAKMICVARDAP